jgi:lysyl-tRNA synthetase class 2
MSAAPTAAPWWRPDRLAARRDNLAARGRVLRAARDFFDAAGYVEVETPAVQVSPGLEPHLRAFATVPTGTASAARRTTPNSRCWSGIAREPRTAT